MTFENKAPKAFDEAQLIDEADVNQAITDNTTDKASTQPITTFKALPKFLLTTDDELQPEFTHTPRPKHST